LLSKKQGIRVDTLCYDVRNQDEVKAAISSLDKNVSTNISILINNAGLAIGKGPIDTGITDDWERMIDTNVKGLLYVSKRYNSNL